jgi:hypothetical protein
VSLAIALLATLAQPTPREAHTGPAHSRIEVTDEHVAAQGANDFLLEQAINRLLFEDRTVQDELMRAGLERGCLLIHSARRQALDANGSAFRPHLIAAMRAIVPAERLAAGTNLVIGGLAAYRTRVTDEVERSAAGVFAAATEQAREGALARLRAAPGVTPAEAPGRFGDWRLETRLARQIACNLIVASQNRTPEEFASMKRPFDGFYRRSGE